MTEKEMIEAMARGMYGKHWDGPFEKMPGEKMKEVWRKYCIGALNGLKAAGYLVVPKDHEARNIED